MKATLLLAMALCAAFNANADSWTMDSQAGGKVVITDRACNEKGTKTLRYAYAYTDKAFLEGCWALMDGKVHVVWGKKDRRVYEINAFVQDHVEPKASVDSPAPKKTF